MTSHYLQHCLFALLVKKNLGRLSQRNKMIAEKRITDILFEIKITELEGGLHQVVKTYQYPPFKWINFQINLHYIWVNIFQLDPMQIYLAQAEIVPLFTWTKCFLLIKQKYCKHSLYFNTVFSFTSSVLFQH